MKLVLTIFSSVCTCQRGRTYFTPQSRFLIKLWFYVPLDTKQVISDTFPKPNSWLGMEKLNLTHIHQSKEMYYIQHKINAKNKARYSCLLRHLAWKQRGPILVQALHKFFANLLTHLLTAPGPHGAFIYKSMHSFSTQKMTSQFARIRVLLRRFDNGYFRKKNKR